MINYEINKQITLFFNSLSITPLFHRVNQLKNLARLKFNPAHSRHEFHLFCYGNKSLKSLKHLIHSHSTGFTMLWRHNKDYPQIKFSYDYGIRSRIIGVGNR